MRVLRSSLLVAATALVAAACGDKVNITPPAVIPPTLHGIVVAPATATISVLQTVQLTAAVSADAGVTPTISWTTTNSGVAGVTQTGLVNGVSAGTAGICAAASATGLTTVSNCAQVVVQPPTTVVPAVLQIASVTVAGNLNQPVPVPPAATAGQINVSVTVNPGTERMDSVQVNLINAAGVSIPGGTQIFTSAQAAVMRSAATDLSAQALITSLVFSINTAAFNPTTGAVTYLNGPYTVTVVGYGHQGTTAAVNSSTNNWPLIFGNDDGWIITQTLGAGTNAVTNAEGFNYVGGPLASLTVSAIPVLYSGAAITTTAPLLPVVTFGTTACGNTVARTQVMTAPVAPSHAFTAVFTRTALAAAGATNVNDYEFSWAACPARNSNGGESSVISGSWYVGNTVGPSGNASTIVDAARIRLDNQAPINMVLTNTPNGRTNGWFNDAVVLNGTTANGVVGTAATDAGAGGIVYTATVGGVAMTSTSTLAESATPATYTVSVIATDALGNATAASTKKFGVDRTLPTLAAINQPLPPGYLGNVNAAFIADPGTGFAFVANDPPGSLGVASSGFFNLASAPVTMSEAARTAAGTKWWCPSSGIAGAYLTSSSVCAAWVSGTNFMTNLVTTDNGIGNAYFLTTASITDQAGNASIGAFTTNLFEVDAIAPTVGNLSPPGSFPTANTSYTYTFPISTTGVDIAAAWVGLIYNAVPFDINTAAAFAGGFTFLSPDQVVDGWNAATLQTSVTASVTFNNLLTNIEMTDAAGANTATAAGAWPTFNTYGGLNQPGLTTIAGAGPFSGFPAFVAITNTGAVGTGPINWLICATALSSAAPCGITPASPAASTITISRAANKTVWVTAVAEGQTAVFNNPFSQVQFWAYDPGTQAGWHMIGIANNSSNVTDNLSVVAPNGRNWQFNMAFTPNLTNAPDNGVYRVIAIGVGGTSLPAAQQGMALATPVGSVSITITP